MRPSPILRGAAVVGLLVWGAPACRTLAGPEASARSYAQALRDGRTTDAYALTSAEFRGRVSAEAFAERYGDPARRAERAAEVDRALAQLHAEGPGIALVREGEIWRVDEPAPAAEGPSQTLQNFLDAAERGDFAAAYALLSESWRGRYSPERLQQDFEREPLSRERLARARRALAQSPVISGSSVDYPLGEGKAVRLVREGGAFRVAALE
jgi:hypothetical protein